MRALKQRELGGLAAFLIVIWTIIRVPKKVNDLSELEECFLPRDVQEKVGLIDRCIKSE